MRKLAMNQPTLVLAVSLLLIDIGPLRPYALAQEATPKAEALSVASIVTFTTQEDHREMQKQLGISKLRRL